MRIFLDVGAYIGEVAKAVLNSKHKFDKIYCFEPQLRLCDIINEIGDDKIIVNKFGLWNCDVNKTIYFQNRKSSASVYLEKFKGNCRTMECRFVKTSTWFLDNIKQDDYVVMKLNCEGSECDILDDLLQSGEYTKIKALMVDFDVRKVPSQEYKENEIREKLKKYSIPSILFGNNEEKQLTRCELNCYYNNREKWTHRWMDLILEEDIL